MEHNYKDNDIAIIGMSGRFPEADTLEEFWANLVNGKESVRPFPESRLKELAEMVGFTPAIQFARYGYLEQATLFEPEIFSISQEECRLMDPQQRLLLELVEEAILDAGYNPENLFNHHVGVFVADNENRYTGLAEVNSPMIFVNSMSASNAGRISYTYNFHGPALVLGTACSSSMVALHYACQAIKLGEAEIAIAGGSNIALQPTAEADVANFPIFSPDMQVRTFDKRANGTIAGEGGGVVLLKRLKEALANGDNIHAIIKGSAINNDGKWSNGITAPSEKGQADVILRAVKSADIDPRTISYVETHGTGTSIGDPIEVAGLSAALRELGLPVQSVPVGALKTNIGHLDSAAGIAGIIKTVLALKYQQLPPSLNFTEPNPLIDFVNAPVYVNNQLNNWNTDQIRRAGVTSLSFVGTNAHVILEEAPRVEIDVADSATKPHNSNLVTLSARTPASLRKMAERLANYLQKYRELSIDEVAYTLNCGRRVYPHKFAAIAHSIEELTTHLRSYLKDGQASLNSLSNTRALGEGYTVFKTSQKHTMLSAVIIPDLIDADFSLDWCASEPVYQQIYLEKAATLKDGELADRRVQYLLHGYTLARLLQQYGIKSKVYVGFGLGEIIVDCIRGDLSFAAAAAKVQQYNKGKLEIPDDRFRKGIGNIQKLGVENFFLVAPGETIYNRFDQCLEGEEIMLVKLDASPRSFQDAILAMLEKGFEPDWQQVYQGRGLKRLSLPGYCFDRKPYILQTSKFRSQTEVAVQSGLQTEVEDDPAQVLEILTGLLKGVYVGGDFTLSDSVLEIDLDSVQVMQFSALVKQRYGVEVPLQLFFQPESVRTVLEQIESMIVPSSTGVIIERQPVQEYYPVSSAQKRQFVLNQIEPESLAYNLPGIFTVSGNLDRTRLEAAFQALIRRHEILRTSFTIVDGQPVQMIQPDTEFNICYLQCSEANLTQTLREFVQPFDLTKPPLLRVGLIESGNTQLLIYDMHHIVSDGTSTWILFREFIQLYAGETLPDQRIQYRDFAVWQNALLETEEYQQMEQYWLNRFSGELPLLNLPTDYPRPAVMEYHGAEYSINLDRDLAQQINQFTAERGITLYMFLLAVYNVLLAKYTGQEDIIVGSPIHGRSHADLQNLIGIFINTLAMRNRPATEKTFAEFVQEVKENALEAYANQDYQFEMLVNHLDLARDLGRNPVFDTMFILQNTSRGEIVASELVFGNYELEKQIAQFDLTLIAGEKGDELNLAWEYCTSLFKPATIERMARHFLQILQNVLQAPERKLAELSILTAEERYWLLNELNQTEVAYPSELTVNQLIEAQVAESGDRVALICGSEELPYRELNARANRIARHLRERGVKPGTIVGLMTQRSFDMICGQLAILKSGGAYLPVDPDYPEERISYMLTDSGAAVLLTQMSMASVVNFSGETIYIDQPEAYTEDDSNLPLLHTAADLAYVIYTSGSTGKPKGVMIEHRALHNFITGIAEQIDFSSGKTIVSLTTISFDIYGLESLLPLAKGLKVVIANEQEQKMPDLLADLILRHQVQMLQATPSRLQLLLADSKCQEALQVLTEIMVGGEAFPTDLLGQVKEVTRARIYNMYGPTETTIWSAVAELTQADHVRLGRPIANTRVYILDLNLNPVPAGINGELYIAGDGLARGYLHQPGLTAERFLADPFQPGQKMYRTGDLAKWNADGMLEFAGRVDYQVKIRGYRIEPGEIEHLLRQHPSIQSAVVIDREDGSGGRYLCAYLVFTTELSVSELRDYLARQLPDYMIPAYFVSLPVIPLTSSGKVDRKVLPAPDGSVQTGVEYVAPQNEIESRLAKILSELMGLSQVGIDDKFFEIGGDSIKIITFTKQVSQAFDCQLKVQDCFKHHTIRKLAQHLNSQRTVEPVKETRKFKY